MNATASEPALARCPNCGKMNRVRPAATGVPHCGNCGATLPWLTESGEADFPAVVEQSSLPVLVDFWAPWCGPCRIVSPIVEELAKEYEGKINVGKLNVDENQQTSSAYGIMSIPTLAFFKKGQVVKTIIGAQPKEAL